MTELGEFAMWGACGLVAIGIFFGPVAKWAARIDDAETLAGLHYVAFSLLMLHKAAPLFVWSS